MSQTLIRRLFNQACSRNIFILNQSLLSSHEPILPGYIGLRNTSFFNK
nr:mitochondrial ribosomal protein S5, isoform D [Drosophila melanogaster]ABI31279.1 mitochondrial ribosomal protein S5, isoform D [Drosophila melanogaster]|eukprot:NP_001036651.1 mitochondrial ribosomal protein S5, isoform D [Drosophila melanogaster]